VNVHQHLKGINVNNVIFKDIKYDNHFLYFIQFISFNMFISFYIASSSM